MKKLMAVLVMLAMTASVTAELVQNYDFSDATESPWYHSGYAAWGGSWVDLTDDYFRGTGWGSSSWTNNAVWQDTGATFAADTVYIMTVQWRDGATTLDDVQLVFYDATTSSDVKKVTTGPPGSGWNIDTLILDTADFPGFVGNNIGVAVRNASSVGAWMDVNYISVIVAGGAYNSAPSDGTTVDSGVTSELSWTYPPSPVGTQTSEVYLGTPNISSATLLSDTDDTDNVVNVSLLPSTAYEWRVDVVDSGAGTITGDVWSFQTSSASSDNDVTIDPDTIHQTFEGFGVGTMDQFIPYWYTVWTTAKLNEYLDQMYTLGNDGLGLEITRVPMAVGDDPSHNHMWAYNQPGMGLRSPEAFETSDGVFDWTGHEEFLWHIQGAEARGVKMWAYWHGVPHWMSVSGCSAGNTDGSNNLPSGSEARFAEHICDVLEHFKNSWSVDFDYVGAINEPDENWWDCWDESTSSWAGNQPGCHVDSAQAVTIHQELKSEMDSRGLTTKMVAPDSYSIAADDDITYLDTLLNSSVGPDIDVYSGHQYSVSDYSAAQWYWRSVKNNKSFWMSEWGDWENAGWPDNEPLIQAENYANKIQQGLKDMKVTAYIFWESRLMIDTTTSSFTPRKAYWVSAQFSRHIRSGMQSVQAYDSDTNSKTSVWIDPVITTDGQKLVMVTVNDSSTAKTANYDLSKFRGVKIDEVRRTSETEDYVSVPITQSSDFNYSVYAPSKSVITVSATIQSCKDMQGDLTDDCFVDMDDLLVVADNWTNSVAYPCSPLAGDTDNDCSVNNIDHANLNTDWLDIEAFNPDPSDGQTGVDSKGTLSWGDNYYAVSYGVYIGTSQSAVQNATQLSSEYQGNTTVASYPYDLSTSQTYYCRVDSEDSVGVFLKGNIWSFTTSSVAIDSDLIGWWKLDDSSVYAQDSSPEDNDGTLYGNPQWRSSLGMIGGALDLDGNGDYVYVPGFELASNTVTMTAWINGWKAGDWAGIVYSRSSASAVATGMHFGGDSKLHYSWNYNDSTTWNWSGGPTIPQDQWALVAMVIEPDKATLYVYPDGGPLQSAVNTMTHVPQMIDNLKFGYDDMDTSRTFNGMLDDVRIYKRALTQQEILNLVP